MNTFQAVAIAAAVCVSSTFVSQAHAVSGATSVVENQEASVGLLVTRRGICTGTLIAPNLVLTAAHCIAQGIVDFRLGTGRPSPISGPGARNGAAIANDVNPNANPLAPRNATQYSPQWGCLQQTFSWDGMPRNVCNGITGTTPVGDFGLVLLARPVAGATIARIADGTRISNGSTCRVIGFGVYQGPTINTTGQKRSGNIVVSHGSTPQDTRLNVGRISTNQTYANPGDSGGPVVCRGSVMGVVSGADGRETTMRQNWGDITFFEATAINWLTQQMQIVQRMTQSSGRPATNRPPTAQTVRPATGHQK